MKNSVELKFKAIPANVTFARAVLASFLLPLNPSVDELQDIKTAVNEAITNVVVHAYPNKLGNVTMKITTNENKVSISIIDTGVGIQDIEKALTPFYTSKPDDERSGMGFTVMEGFMDKVEVKNNKEGLMVKLTKTLASVG